MGKAVQCPVCPWNHYVWAWPEGYDPLRELLKPPSLKVDSKAEWKAPSVETFQAALSLSSPPLPYDLPDDPDDGVGEGGEEEIRTKINRGGYEHGEYD